MNNNKLIILFICITLSLLMPGALLAEDAYKGSVTIGASVTDLDNVASKSGEYDGIKDDEANFVGDADISYEKDTYYMEINVKDAGLENRNITVESGKPGTYNLSLEYNEVIQLISNTASTPFGGAGSGNLSLPAGFTQYVSTTDIVNNYNFSTIDLEQKRKAGIVDYSRKLGRNISLNLSFKREDKEGIKSVGGVLGTSGRFTSSAILPEPVDYTTDELSASIGYADAKKQFSLGYFLSKFDNDNDSLTWDNPFLKPGGADYPTLARMSLPPDNEYHRFSLNAAVNVSNNTRFSAIAEYGIMEQDEKLLDYSTNGEAPPRANADAEINTTHLTLKASSRPTPKLSLAAKYRYYKTKNKLPRQDFLRVVNDTGAQQVAGTEKNNYSLPFDYEQNKLSLDASYRVAKRSTAKVGFDYETMERDYRAVEENKESTYRAALSSRLSDSATTNLNYSYAERKNDGGYDQSRVYNNYYTATYIALEPNPALRYDTHPDMRRSDIAERDREKYGVNVTFDGAANSTFGLSYNRLQDEYDDSIFGLQRNENRNYTIDVTTSPSKDLSFFAFYTADNQKSEQASRHFTAGTKDQAVGDVPFVLGDITDWWANHDDNHDVVGLGSKIDFLGGDLTIDADYTYARSKSAIDFEAIDPFNSSAVATTNMPDIKSERHTLNLTGRYKIDKKKTIGLGYAFEQYNSQDWATDGLNPDTIAQVLSMTGTTPDYRSHLIKLFLTCKL